MLPTRFACLDRLDVVAFAASSAVAIFLVWDVRETVTARGYLIHVLVFGPILAPFLTPSHSVSAEGDCLLAVQ
ncbi:unnamed protein product [Peniophora sp. CBMAI 1063]|nr:unnamed protein product [Peniophora sp. CBMAI 1063]